jgi:hypothetical protein
MGLEQVPLTIRTQSRYPFEEQLEMIIDPAAQVQFPLTLRIPGWCDSSILAINGQPVEASLQPGSFTTIERLWQPGDVVHLLLPFKLSLQHWPGGGISLHYGPLTLALPVPSRAEIEVENSTTRQRKETLGDGYEPRPAVVKEAFPAWNLYPNGPWNYALFVDEESLKNIRVDWNPNCHNPLDSENPAFRVLIKARRIQNWRLVHRHKARQFGHWSEDGNFCRGKRTISGDFQFTPPLPDPEGLERRLSDEVEEIALIPYGATLLRMTIFPQAGKE